VSLLASRYLTDSAMHVLLLLLRIFPLKMIHIDDSCGQTSYTIPIMRFCFYMFSVNLAAFLIRNVVAFVLSVIFASLLLFHDY